MTILQNNNVNILVIDQDADSRESIREILNTDGYGCQVADSAASASRMVGRAAPDLIISDTDIGNTCGFVLCQELKAKSGQSEVPVVFVSDSRGPEVVTDARRAGATYFLSKPFDPAVLLELVDKALWMPHLVRRHVDSKAHPLKPSALKLAPEGISDPVASAW